MLRTTISTENIGGFGIVLGAPVFFLLGGICFCFSPGWHFGFRGFGSRAMRDSNLHNEWTSDRPIP